MQKCASLGRFHNLEEFHEFVWSSKIFGVRKILENCQNQPFYAILSHFATYPTRGPQGGVNSITPPLFTVLRDIVAQKSLGSKKKR